MTETGILSGTEQLAQLDIYRRQRDQYLSNAEEAASRQEFRKASELLWGAVVQSIKALALVKRNVSISSHSQYFPLMQQLARELGDPPLYTDFLFVENLHRNFYDEQFPDSDFQIYKDKAVALIRRLQQILEEFVGRSEIPQRES